MQWNLDGGNRFGYLVDMLLIFHLLSLKYVCARECVNLLTCLQMAQHLPEAHTHLFISAVNQLFTHSSPDRCHNYTQS